LHLLLLLLLMLAVLYCSTSKKPEMLSDVGQQQGHVARMMRLSLTLLL
jgi:hypothetical protein